MLKNQTEVPARNKRGHHEAITQLSSSMGTQQRDPGFGSHAEAKTRLCLTVRVCNK